MPNRSYALPRLHLSHHPPLELRGHSAFITANVDGLDVPLIFDSGDSTPLNLRQDILDQIHAQPTGQTKKIPDAKSHVVDSPKYSVHRLQIGDVVFTDVTTQVDIHDPTYPATELGQKGFLGTGLLKNYEVILNYPDRTMTLIPRAASDSASPTCQGATVPFVPAWHGEPVTEVTIDQGHPVMWWDTGAPDSVLTTRFAHSPERTLTSKRLLLAGINYGPLQLQVENLTLPPGFDGFIGYNFFARHIVCFDFPRHRLVIRR